MTPVDPDAVAEAVLACPGVVAMSGGALGEAASYLPGRRVPGVRATEEELEVHVVARWTSVLPEVADAVRAAVAPLAPGRPVSVFIEDVEVPETARAS
ncbi:MAG: hypothetical protein M3N28_04835 [Actinomycetota bacterium]|nr:hypothetical protein [Actinomycetota bacterium]